MPAPADQAPHPHLPPPPAGPWPPVPPTWGGPPPPHAPWPASPPSSERPTAWAPPPVWAPPPAWGPPPSVPPGEGSAAEEPWPPHRDIEVQHVLLALGTLLVGVAVTVFAAVNWRRLDATAQGLVLVALTGVIGAVSVAAGRRSRAATAEWFAAAAVLLALADVHAFRVGLAPSADAGIVWAGGLLVVAVGAWVLASAARVRSGRIAAVLLAPLAVPVATAGRWGVEASAVALIAQSTVVVVGSSVLRGASVRPARQIGRAWAVALVIGAELTAAAAWIGHAIDGDEPAVAWWSVALAVAGFSGALAATCRDRAAIRGLAVPVGVLHLLVGVAGAAGASTLGARPGNGLAAVAMVAAIGLLLATLLPARRMGEPAAAFGLGLGVASLPVLGAVATVLIAASEAASPPWSREATTVARSLALRPLGIDALVLVVHLAALLLAGLGAGRVLHRSGRARPIVVAVGSTTAVLVTGALVLPLLIPLTIGQVVLGALAVEVAAVLGWTFVADRRARLPFAAVVLGAQVWALAWGAASAELTLQALLVSAGAMALVVALARERRDLLAIGAVGWLGVGLPAVAGLGALASDLPAATAWAAAAVVGSVVGVAAQLLLDAGGQGGRIDLAASRTAEATSLGVHLAALAAIIAASATDPLAIVLASGTVALVLHGLRPDRRPLLLGAGGEGLALTWLLLARQDVGLVEAYTLPLAGLLLLLGLVVARPRAVGPVPSWWSIGPGLLVALAPTVVLGIVDGGVVRPLVGIVAGAVLLVGGAVRGRRAPFDIGATAVAALALEQAAPVVGGLPNWATIGATGLALLAVGATFDQRRADLRSARRRWSALT